MAPICSFEMIYTSLRMVYHVGGQRLRGLDMLWYVGRLYYSRVLCSCLPRVNIIETCLSVSGTA